MMHWLIAYWCLFLLLAWYPCCCGDSVITHPCTSCDPDAPDTISVTIGSLSDGNCPCSDINGTYILDWSGTGTPSTCAWSGMFVIHDWSPTDFTVQIEAGLGYDGFTGVVYQVQFIIRGTNATDSCLRDYVFRGVEAGVTTVDCSDNFTVPFWYSSGSGFTCGITPSPWSVQWN